MSKIIPDIVKDAGKEAGKGFAKGIISEIFQQFENEFGKHPEFLKKQGLLDYKLEYEQPVFLTGLKLLANGADIISPNINVEAKTLGGQIHWIDISSYEGWKVQQNKHSKKCRVLNDENKRIAWGSKRRLHREFIKMIILVKSEVGT